MTTTGEAKERPPVDLFDVKREYRQHRKTGTIAAIELVNGQLQGARECTRPEEQTDGALPVLTLHTTGDFYDYYKANAGDFVPWEPNTTPEGLRRKLTTAGHRLDDLDTKISKKKNELKALNEQRDQVVKQIRRHIRDLETGQSNLLDTADAVDAAADDPEDGEDATGDPPDPDNEAGMNGEEDQRGDTAEDDGGEADLRVPGGDDGGGGEEGTGGDGEGGRRRGRRGGSRGAVAAAAGTEGEAAAVE